MSNYSRSRWQLLLATLSLAWMFFILILQLTIQRQNIPLQSEEFKHEIGCAYQVQINHRPFAWPVMQFESDGPSSPNVSRLVLLENGNLLGQPHTLHETIRNQGGGNFSHWGKTLYFSTADCSDPRINGNRYEVSMSGSLSFWVKLVWLAAALVFISTLKIFKNLKDFRSLKEMPDEGQLEKQVFSFRINRSVSIASMFLALFFAGMILTARGAADIGSYFAWANYFATSDITTLSSFAKSVTGVPFIQWSYGSGLLPAIMATIVGYSSALPISIIAVLLGIANVALLVYIAFLKTGSLSKATLILAAITLFTPAGFYFNKYCAEGWTILLVLSGLTLIEWNKKYKAHASNYAAFMLGVLMYFLILVKSQNIVLCLSLWVIFIANNFSTPFKSKGNLRFILEKTSIIVVVGGIGLAFLLVFNHVVSGNLFRNPYDVGDAEFSMFSIHNLKIYEVLFSSWHGLLVYHPVIGVAIYFLLRELTMERASAMKLEFLVISSCLAVFALQLLIQSAWFIWWMGTGTFGARGFCGAAVLLAYALMHCKSIEKLPLTNSIYAAVLILGMFSAYMLTIQETNIVNYENFLAVFRSNHSVVAYGAVISTVIILQIIKMRLKLSKSTHISYLLLAFALVPGISGIGASSSRIQFAVMFTVVLLLLAHNSFWHKTRSIYRSIQLAVFAAFITIFSVSIVLQIELLQDFHEEAKVSKESGKSLDCNEYVSSYNEYQLLKGYEQEKRELYDFLVRQNCYN